VSKLLALLFAFALLAGAVAHEPEGVVTPGANLVAEGIPPIPASLVEEVNRYGEYRAAFLLDWHPKRREMLISTRFGDTPQIHRLMSPGGDRRQLTFFPDAVTRASYEPGGKSFLFEKSSDGNEQFQQYRYDLESGAVTLLTDGTSRNGSPFGSNSGDRIAYTSTRRNGTDTDLYVMDPKEPGSSRLLAEMPGGGWSPVGWSPDDRSLLVSEWVSVNESYLWLVDIHSGRKRLVTPKGGSVKAVYVWAAFSRDGRRLYVTTDRDSEFIRLATLDLNTGRHTYLTSHIPWDVSGCDISHDRSMIAFVANEEGVGRLHLLDLKSGKERPVAGLPPGNLADVKWHRNGRDLGFGISSARHPMDAYSLDVKTGRVVRWTASETGVVNTAHLLEPELIRWKSFDGRFIPGFLYRPPSRFTGRRPVVIDIHGGPESQFRPGFLGRRNYYTDRLGVALLFPNLRGSSGYGKSFLKLDNGMLREGAYQDLEALLDWIRTRPDLDAERVMVTGGSYGGHLTLIAATRYSDRIRCAVEVVGPSSLVTFLQNTAAYRRDLRRAEFGDERDGETRAFMERTAPLNNAGKVRKPLFVIAGRNDPRAPVTESEQMIAAVRRSGTPVWYLMAQDGMNRRHR
jgi:dipeptidyl aminopeptidase/acylaminoacyl peptidase